MRLSFFTWYYTSGVRVGFRTLGNIIFSFWRRFNISGLLLSLLSPWRKDVTPRDWLGLHPIKSLGRLMENLLTRFLGMIVRLLTIGVGVGAILSVAVGGTIVLGGSLFAPAFIATGIFGALVGASWGLPLFFLGVVGLFLMVYSFIERESEPILKDSSFATVSASRLFPRVLARLGLVEGAFPEAILADEEAFLQYLKDQGYGPEMYERAVLIEEHRLEQKRKKKNSWSEENLSKVSRIGKYWKYGYTPRLDSYSLDLSNFDPTSYRHADLIGRNDVLRNVLITLERPSENSVLLVGEAGTGKQTFVHYLARLIRENAFEGTLFDEMRVLVLDLGAAVSEATNTGQDPDNLVRHLLSEAAFAGNIILVIEHIDHFLLTDSRGRNFSGIFSEYLALPSLRMIATTSTAHYHDLLQEDEGVLKHVEEITLPETNKDETLAVLIAEFADQEEHQVLFSLPALESIIKNADRTHWETPFPERAIDLAEEVLTYFRGTSEDIISVATIDAYIEQKSGVPRGEIGQAERDKLLHLEELLHSRVIGQEKAVKEVAESLRKARAGFGNDKRPIGSFLFLGPTGVGKTETVKALAFSYFGDEKKMIRLDMSEFQTPEAVDRLIGSSGKGIQGKLTDAVSEHPYSILLLDELEKAYPPALDLFLQILDEGFVTDGFGQKINFRNMIIIATSNAGAVMFRRMIEAGTAQKEIEKQVMDQVIEDGLFRPEFLNRFDGIIFFSPLGTDELIRVVELKLAALQARLKEEKNIRLVFEPGLAQAIVANGYEPEFGARSLNRYMDDILEDRIAKAIIEGTLVSGGTLTLSPESLAV